MEFMKVFTTYFLGFLVSFEIVYAEEITISQGTGVNQMKVSVKLALKKGTGVNQMKSRARL